MLLFAREFDCSFAQKEIYCTNMFTKIICVAFITVALVEASPVKVAIKDGHSDYYELHGIPSGRKINYQVSYDLVSGDPTDVKGYHVEDGHAVSWEKKHKSSHIVRKFSKSAKGVLREGVHNLGKEVDSVVGIGKSVLHGVKTILDSNVKLVASIPKVGLDSLGDWFKK